MGVLLYSTSFAIIVISLFSRQGKTARIGEKVLGLPKSY
jgi:hypothetical protein